LKSGPRRASPTTPTFDGTRGGGDGGGDGGVCVGGAGSVLVEAEPIYSVSEDLDLSLKVGSSHGLVGKERKGSKVTAP
jgi:hypothetical protein